MAICQHKSIYTVMNLQLVKYGSTAIQQKDLSTTL